MLEAKRQRVISLEIEEENFEAELNNFFEKEENRDNVVLLYLKQEYMGAFSFYDWLKSGRGRELEYYVRYVLYHGMAENEEAVREIFDNSGFGFLVMKEGRNEGDYAEIYNSIDLDKCISNKIINRNSQVGNELKREGIYVKYIRFPSKTEIKESGEHQSFNLNIGDRFTWKESKRNFIEKYLYRITEYNYETFKEKIFYKLRNYKNEEKIIGRKNRTIFLVGPCIVVGQENIIGEDLVSILHKLLLALNLDYQIVRIGNMYNVATEKDKILQYDIKKNDVVLFFDSLGAKEDTLDMTECFSSWKGEKWLYTNIPIHTTLYGNQVVAEEIVEKIIKPLEERVNRSEDSVIIHHANRRQQVTWETDKKIKCYLHNIPVYEGANGSIVMNCNPFTLGHRYLVEQAAKRCDRLYLFVVEEDASYFAFQDRLSLVRKGTEDLKNVIVVPSGKFILSKATFKGYFEKESQTEELVDTSQDLNLFTEYVTPYLKITKRFVGEEPFDKVTAQYNKQMKEILPVGGVEVVEIPRKATSGEAISASRVRKLLKERAWEKIAELVPETTLNFLQENIDRFEMDYQRRRALPQIEMSWVMKEYLEKLIGFVRNNPKIICYGLGRETEKFLSTLDEEEFSKLEFCDKRAEKEETFYVGKKVITPKQLCEEAEGKYREYAILVMPLDYGMEIYEMLRDAGIAADRIMCHTIWLPEQMES